MRHGNDLNAVRGIIKRLLGSKAVDQFILENIPAEKGKHVFELDNEDEKVAIRGSSPVSIAFGLNWYLKYFCEVSFSWGQNQLRLPETLPGIHSKVRKVRPYQYFYNLNFVVYSYSMAFWDWERWEKELDWMALNGVDLVLEMTGHEEVWRRTLRKLGYTDPEIKDYICGPAYFPFQWLGVMYGWGGPLPDQWFSDRVELAHKIHKRMQELGMTRILPGYTGIVPRDFKEKYPDANPIPQGDWAGMDRPSIIAPNDPVFSLVAQTFYEEQMQLFGTDHFYAADPFHEGGNMEEVDLTKAAELIQSEMLKIDPNAIWVLQGWWDNPKPELIAGLNKEHTVILDLWGENSPRWKREGENVFYGTPWIWTFLHNFGGRLGMYGDMEGSVHNLLEALHSPESKNLIGMGLAPEGIEQNPVMYDLISEMSWRTEVDVDEWLSLYIIRRYGKSNENAQKAWDLLKESVYGYSKQPGPTQSIINQRPSKEGEDQVFNWDSIALYYDKLLLEEACHSLYKAFDELSESEGYLYDLVDVTRQALANKALELHRAFMDAYEDNDKERFEQYSSTFLDIILAQDQLLNTRQEFQLGPWLEQAKSLGHTSEEKSLYEYNARTLITVWSSTGQEILHDYANKEWAGLTRDFYLPRWQMYIDSLKSSLESGDPPKAIHWFEWEHSWAKKTNTFPTEPDGDIRTIVGNIIHSYFINEA